MKVDIRATAADAAQQAAGLCGDRIEAAIDDRGVACIALSGGRTPLGMLRELSGRDLCWNRVHIFQADERACPMDSEDRNFKHIQAILPAQCHLHPMPVHDLTEGANGYARELGRYAGNPAVLDVIHLGLGADGHTASLIPGDPVIEITDRDVAWTAPYLGYRRMTLTFPVLDRARLVFWLVTGAEKRAALAGLLAGDAALPASRVRASDRQVIADVAAGR